MARGAGALTALLLALTLGPVAVLALNGAGFALTAADWAAVRFTVTQAALSAAASVVLAVPVARALARRRFPGRGAMVVLMGAPFLLPVIVAVLGVLTVFGRAGWVNAGLATAGLPPVSVYGLHGVVLAHVFLNLPLAVRLILGGWQMIPAERFRLAESLSFAPAHVFRHLEWPMLREVVPGAALVIFTVCLTSFAVALTLGGGPGATTVELAIYQALRFEFDLGAAARLSLVQLALCLGAFGMAQRAGVAAGFGGGLDRMADSPAPGGWRRGADAAVLVAVLAFVAAPLLAVVLRGLPGLASLPPEVWAALGNSLMVALGATALALGAALPLALAAAGGSRMAALAGTLPLALSSLALGTGLFLIVQPWARPTDLALPVTLLVNALLALPFALRILMPPARGLAGQARLADHLGLTGLARLRWVTLPRLARPLGFAAGVVAALAMGDLGAIALFAAEEGATLPLVVQRLMAAYRMDQAAGAALVLVAASFALFALFDGIGRRAAP